MCKRSSIGVCTPTTAIPRIVLLNALLQQRKEEDELNNLIGKMKECAACATADGVPLATLANLEALRLPDEVQQLLREKSVPPATQATFNWPEDGALFVRA